MPATRARPAQEQPLNVFVVDDDVDVILTVAEILRDEGHNVSTCANATIALDAMRQFKPHVCIIDLKMPAKSGYDLARDVRAARLERVPVLIAMSGHYLQKESERLLARTAGFDHFVLKGADPAELLAILDGLQMPPAAA